MRIARQTPTELVTVDSTLWVSCLCAVGAAFCLYSLMIHGYRLGETLLAVFLLVFASGFALKTRFVFNAMQRTASWSRRRFLFWAKSGTIAFDAIQDIGMDSSAAARGVLTYRLTIVTAQGTVPMSDNFSGGKQRKDELREKILLFVGKKASSANEANESSLRSLLAQGRKIEAIELLKSSRNISLTEAKQMVDALVAKQKSGE
jgi:hypothetical protein